MRAFLLASVFSCLMIAPVMAQNAGVDVLLGQAKYWRGQNRPDRALQSFDRVLTVDPNNVEALGGAAAAAAEAGNPTGAASYLDRLRKISPNDPRLNDAQRSVRAATIDPTAVSEVRRLAQNNPTGAVARYRELFGGNTPPDAYAVEYYQALAGTPDGYDQARRGFEGLVQSRPNDKALQLRYAQILTYREGSREEGLRRLRALRQDPAVSEQANTSLRQGLLWQGANPAAIPSYEQYLQANPNDVEVQRALQQARTPTTTPADPLDVARVEGFHQLNRGELTQAAENFEKVLAQRPTDSDALGGLGVVRLRQGRTAEARRLLQTAISTDPEKGRQKWGQALAGASATGVVTQARALINRGRLEEAETVLRRTAAGSGNERTDAQVLLGDLALRRNDPQGAEVYYREALARRNNLAPALAGLYDALMKQGRTNEAEALAQSTGTAFASASAAQRAESLRNEASRTTDAQTAIPLLRAAAATDPSSPWIRLDLARLLASTGQLVEADGIMQESATSSSRDSLYAAALYAQEQNRPAEAVRLINRIPARQRTAEQTALLQTVQTQDQVRSAVQQALLNPLQGRQQLLALAARPDPTGSTAALVVEGLNGINDKAGAVEAARVALAVNRSNTPQARITLAGALLQAGLEEEARRLTAGLMSASLTPDQQRQLVSLQAGVAVRNSDRLNEAGNQAAAFDQLAPVLQQDPQNVPANLALARLYQTAQAPKEAQLIAEALLARNPRDPEARNGAIEAALSLGQRARAETLLEEGKAMFPNDPRFTLLEARLARANNDPRRAQAALQLAAQQRQGQLGTTQAPAQPAAFANPFRNTANAQLPAGVSNDPLLLAINREYARVREESATQITVGGNYRSRSGQGGVDASDMLSGNIAVSAAVPGVGGRITASAQPVVIDSGRSQADNGTLRRIGSNASVLPGDRATISTDQAQRATPSDSTASGVALSVGYKRDNFSADIGTTPLGFARQNIVGGVEVAPAITPNIRVRATAERRAIDETMLSYAGRRDPLTSQVWGGVVRNTARGQVEVNGPTPNTNFYVGGGYSTLEGDGVADNTRIEANAGMRHTLINTPDGQLTTGFDVSYQAYDKNLRMQTLGHGGYFSPQSYVAASIPVDYRGRSGNLSYNIGASLGVASFKEDRAPFFPNDPNRQRDLEGRSAQDPTITAFFPGQSQTGFIGGLRAGLEYEVNPSMRLGAGLSYDKSANFSETRGMVYARYTFE